MPETPLTRREFLKLTGSTLASGLLAGSLLSQEAGALAFLKKEAPKSLRLTSQDTLALATLKQFPDIEGGLPGLSATQVQAHLKLYAGYVKKHASISQALAAMGPNELAEANATHHPFRGLLAERSYALNGALLHEYYFEALHPKASKPSASFQTQIQQAFGSWEAFQAQVLAAGSCMRGWAILTFNLWNKRLELYGLDTHNMFAPMHSIPLLVVDVYEHAYMIDYDTRRSDYLSALWQQIHWPVVEARLAMVKP